MNKEIKDRLMALQPERRAKVINAARSVVARRVKRNNKLLMENLRSKDKPVVIRQALKAGLIRSADPAHPRAGYVPYWA